MKKILLLVPDGIGIKNYLYTNSFKSDQFSVNILHNFDSKTIDYLKEYVNFDKDYSIPRYIEGGKTKFLRELICYLRLKRNARITKNKTILLNWRPPKKKIKQIVLYRLIEFVSIFFRSYSSIQKLENSYYKTVRSSEYYKKCLKILKIFTPSLLFTTHQRSIYCSPLFLAAKELSIESVTVIYSWDNLPKARLAFRADKYFVWSDYMKNEFKKFYPEIKDSNIKITGTPQFEFYYNDDNIIEKEKLFKDFGLDTQKKTICFSGDDELTSPNDALYLFDLAKSIEDQGSSSEIQILFRRCPVDVSGRYDEVIKSFPNIIFPVEPDWSNKNKDWSQLYPYYNDVKLLTSISMHSDAVINVGSTMAMDFAVYNKTAVYLNYDIHPIKSEISKVENIYNFEHFKSMPNSDMVLWINKKEDLDKLISDIISENIEVTARPWLDKIAMYKKESSSLIKKEIIEKCI